MILHLKPNKSKTVSNFILTFEDLKSIDFEVVESKGIDHIIEFSTIVENLWNIDETKSYDSEILQIIRLVRMYKK